MDTFKNALAYISNIGYASKLIEEILGKYMLTDTLKEKIQFSV